MKIKDKKENKYRIVIERDEPQVTYDMYGTETEEGRRYLPIYGIEVTDEEVIELLRLILSIREKKDSRR